jgi:low affinity Fe/Cu permease
MFGVNSGAKMDAPNEPNRRNGPHPARRWDDKWWVWAVKSIGVPVLCIVVLTVVYFGLESNTDRRLKDADRRIEANLDRIQQTQRDVIEIERADAETARTTAYRICQRHSVVDRAFAHWAVGPRAARRLEQRDALPILDCKPNLRGRGARLLTPKEQRAIVERWRTGNLTNEEVGVCPKSTIGKEGDATNC